MYYFLWLLQAWKKKVNFKLNFCFSRGVAFQRINSEIQLPREDVSLLSPVSVKAKERTSVRLKNNKFLQTTCGFKLWGQYKSFFSFKLLLLFQLVGSESEIFVSLMLRSVQGKQQMNVKLEAKNSCWRDEQSSCEILKLHNCYWEVSRAYLILVL